MQSVIDKIKALPNAAKPDGMWSTLRRRKEKQYGKTQWKKNPIKLIPKPADALAFKQLPIPLRDKLVNTAPVKSFDPRKLVTNQPMVSQADLVHFADHGTDPDPVIILKSTDGLYVHNGNHRSALAMMRGRKVKARYIDLSQVPQLKGKKPIPQERAVDAYKMRDNDGVFTSEEALDKEARRGAQLVHTASLRDSAGSGATGSALGQRAALLASSMVNFDGLVGEVFDAGGPGSGRHKEIPGEGWVTKSGKFIPVSHEGAHGEHSDVAKANGLGNTVDKAFANGHVRVAELLDNEWGLNIGKTTSEACERLQDVVDRLPDTTRGIYIDYSSRGGNKSASAHFTGGSAKVKALDWIAKGAKTSVFYSAAGGHPFDGEKTEDGYGIGNCKECGKPWKNKAHWRIAAGGPGSGRHPGGGVVRQGKIVKWGLTPKNEKIFAKYGLKVKLVDAKQLQPSEHSSWRQALFTFMKSPRDRKYLDGLTDGMRAGKLVYPLEVEKNKSGGYDVMDGHNRYVAATEAGETKIAVFESPVEAKQDKFMEENLDLQKVVKASAISAGGPGSGWTTENGHVSNLTPQDKGQKLQKMGFFHTDQMAAASVSSSSEEAAVDNLSPGSIAREMIRSKALGVSSAAYKLAGVTSFQGLPISIENKKGDVRSGVDADGTKWSVVMPESYGYIKGTKGADGSPIDCFVGPLKDAKFAYICHINKTDGSGFDEDKTFIGFASATRAKAALLAAYSGVDVFHSMTILPMHEFIKRVLSTKNSKRPHKIHAEVAA